MRYLLSFLLGIVFGDFFTEAGGGEEWIFLFFVVFVFVHFSKNFRSFIFLILFFLFGFLRFNYAFVEEFELLGVGKFEGIVCDEVDVRAEVVKYTVCVDGVKGRVLVNADKYPLYRYGDRVEVLCDVEKPEPIEDFEYDKYLARYGIYAVCYRAELRFIEEERGVFFYIYEMKKAFESRLLTVFPEPYGGFMAGLLLGSRRGISEDLMDKFNRTGLTHIIAISGYNITMVIVVVSSLFGVFSKKVRIFSSVVFVIFFVIFVGASAAVVRAGIMGVISLVALWFGVGYYVFWALFLSAFLMNLWNPFILIYDVGFQLSFLATLGILYFSPKLENFFKKIPDFVGIKEAFLLTVSAQIFTLPVILYHFGRFSWVAPFANMMVLPLIPFAMFLGFLGILFGKTFGVFAYVVLKVIIFIVEFWDF